MNVFDKCMYRFYEKIKAGRNEENFQAPEMRDNQGGAV